MNLRTLSLTLAGAAFGFACAAGVSSTSATSPTPPPSNGMVVVDSAVDVPTTVSNLEAAIAERGLRLFTIIDHASNAAGAGLELPPTTVVLFGNPKAGTPLMQSGRTIAIDLPQKMLVWEDESGVHLAYNDPAWLGARHSVESPALRKIAGLLAALAREASATTP